LALVKLPRVAPVHIGRYVTTESILVLKLTYFIVRIVIGVSELSISGKYIIRRTRRIEAIDIEAHNYDCKDQQVLQQNLFLS
jgi:hypothetical protein